MHYGITSDPSGDGSNVLARVDPVLVAWRTRALHRPRAAGQSLWPKLKSVLPVTWKTRSSASSPATGFAKTGPRITMTAFTNRWNGVPPADARFNPNSGASAPSVGLPRFPPEGIVGRRRSRLQMNGSRCQARWTKCPAPPVRHAPTDASCWTDPSRRLQQDLAVEGLRAAPRIAPAGGGSAPEPGTACSSRREAPPRQHGEVQSVILRQLVGVELPFGWNRWNDPPPMHQ